MDQNPNQNNGSRLGSDHAWMVDYASNLYDLELLAAKHGVALSPYSRTATSGTTFADRLAQLEAKIAESGKAELKEAFTHAANRGARQFDQLAAIQRWGVPYGLSVVEDIPQLKANLDALAEHLKTQGKNSCNAEIIQLTAQRDELNARLEIIHNWAKSTGHPICPRITEIGDLNSVLAGLADHLKTQGRKEAEGEIAELKRKLDIEKVVYKHLSCKTTAVNKWAARYNVAIAYGKDGPDAVNASLADIEAKLIEKGRAEGREQVNRGALTTAKYDKLNSLSMEYCGLNLFHSGQPDVDFADMLESVIKKAMAKAVSEGREQANRGYDAHYSRLNNLATRYGKKGFDRGQTEAQFSHNLTAIIEKAKAEAVQEYKAQLASEKADQTSKRLRDMILGGSESVKIDIGKPFSFSTAEKNLGEDIRNLEQRVANIETKLSEPVKLTVTVDAGGEA